MQVIIAALNEEQGIGHTITELMHCLCPSKVIVVDGKSSDRTVEVAKNMGAEIIFQDGNGKGNAIARGIEHLDPAVDYVVVTDADYTYPVEYVPEMIQTLEDNPRVGMVCGNRFNGNAATRVFRDVFFFGNKLIGLTHHLMNGVRLQDPLTGLRVIRTKLLRNWQVKSNGFDVEIELNHYVERMGYTTVEVPIQYRPRLGEKKLKIFDGATILRRILLEAFSTRSKHLITEESFGS